MEAQAAQRQVAQPSQTFRRRWDIVPDRGSYQTLHLIDIDKRGVTSEVVVGRPSNNPDGKSLESLIDPTKKVEKKHCKLSVKDGECWLEDMSANGTWMSSWPSTEFVSVKAKTPVRLHHNDKIRLLSSEHALRQEATVVPILTVCSYGWIRV